MFSPIGSKATVAAFAPLGREIITGHESGKVALFDAEDGSEIETNEKAHLGQVTDLQLSPDGTYFVTASKDQTAKVSQQIGIPPVLITERHVDIRSRPLHCHSFMTRKTSRSSRPSHQKRPSTALSLPR
jgi:WD40 repeat protein